MRHDIPNRKHLFYSAAAIGTAHAASQNETFRDWNASLDEVNTGEDVRKICTAATIATDAAGKAWTQSRDQQW